MENRDGVYWLFELEINEIILVCSHTHQYKKLIDCDDKPIIPVFSVMRDDLNDLLKKPSVSLEADLLGHTKAPGADPMAYLLSSFFEL